MRPASILAGLAALASVPAFAHPARTPEAQLADEVRGRVAGALVDCIDPHDVTSTEIIDGTAILYRVGGRLYVNRPRGGAQALRDDDVLMTQVYGAQLCRRDIVRLVDRASRGLRGFVSLGAFVPYTKLR